MNSLLEAIVREFADSDPTYETGTGDLCCMYCSGMINTDRNDHELTCLLVRAKQWCEENPQ